MHHDRRAHASLDKIGQACQVDKGGQAWFSQARKSASAWLRGAWRVGGGTLHIWGACRYAQAPLQPTAAVERRRRKDVVEESVSRTLLKFNQTNER